ncbi:MAG: hypothetical protein H7070_07850 [Saprospiraceae bacterium]|nr:hypothetical protein [Pyrinomonadaceae bacterium]
MERLTESRRDFLKLASASLVLPLLFGCEGETSAQRAGADIFSSVKSNAITAADCSWCGAKDVPDNVSWKTKLSSDTDKAGRIMIQGTVYQTDGKTPAPNTLIYLYHTDIYGIYGKSGEHPHGRYRGWMLTGADGKYEFESIKPASYPDSTISAHIHMTVTGKDRKEDWIDSILFEGDRFITARERIPQKGGFNPILKLESGANGILHAIRDIKLMS